MGSRIDQLNEFLKDNPKDSFVLHALGLEYVKLGDDERARALFEEVLQNDPSYVGSYYHLGKLFERINRADEAITTYKTGMQTAKEVKDMKAYHELEAAYEDLM